MPDRIVPATGQESVWDYPRPPRIEPTSERVVVRFGGEVVVDTTSAVRVLETSHPPVYYLPRAAFGAGMLLPSAGLSYCEFKGEAHYLSVAAGGDLVEAAAWFYPEPQAGYEQLRDYVSLYPARMDAVLVDGELVDAQAGGFYGGWITSRVVGPFKGEQGSENW
jgi:uncharacterized protein (DUF427 family)